MSNKDEVHDYFNGMKSIKNVTILFYILHHVGIKLFRRMTILNLKHVLIFKLFILVVFFYIRERVK